MSKPGRLFVVFGLIAFAAVTGFWFGRPQSPEASALVKSKSSSEAGADEAARLRDEVTRLKLENDRLIAAANTATSSTNNRGARLAQLRALVDAKKNQGINISPATYPIITREGKLAPSFAAMFDLTTAETAALEGALADGRKQMDALLAANATVTTSGDTLVVAVKPFTGGGEVYDGLMDAFARMLGPERNELFVAFQTDQLTEAFNNFGGEKRTLTFSLEAIGGPEPSVRLTDAYETPRSHGSSMMGFPSLAKLPDKYAWVIPVAPQLADLPVSVAPPRPARRP